MTLSAVKSLTKNEDLARWLACFALALLIHFGGALALLAHWANEPDLVANAPIIMVELAPVAAAPQTQPTELPPGPQQAEAKPELEIKLEKPPKKIDLPSEPTAEQLLAVTPPSKPPEKTKDEIKQKQASVATAPSTADLKAGRAAAPAPGAASRNPYAVLNWRSQLVAKLERSKRYPAEAHTRRQQGVAQLAFSIDRNGGVHDARIVRSSGSPLLDRETLAMLERAQPLPPPPTEMHGSQVEIVVPIRYNIR